MRHAAGMTGRVAISCNVPMRVVAKDERMTFSVEHISVQAYNVRRTEQQEEVLQSLGGPVTLHPVKLARIELCHVVDRTESNLRSRLVRDGLEHGPGFVPQPLVASNTIQDKD